MIEKSVFNKFKYSYSPRGPLVSDSASSEQKLKAFNFLTQELKKNKSIFFRFEARQNLVDSLMLSGLPLLKTIDLQPKKTLMIDLGKSEEEILKEMHQKTRYNIRLAKKKGLVIQEGGLEDFEDFWRLMQQTAERDKFRVHTKNHYQNLIRMNQVKLFFVLHENKKIATGLFSFFGNKATYLHGASDNNYRALMAPYLLQFEMMMRAKNEGYSLYDFYGIDELKWPGVTRFKMGFGGFVYEYAGTYDLVFKKFLYNLYNLLRSLRRMF